MSKNLAIGIDLGTTFSCVGVWKDNKVEVIVNEQGNRTTPSWVAFTDTERLVGESAKNQFSRNPNNTVYDVKRLMGRLYTDKELQTDMTNSTYKVVDNNGRPNVNVSFKNENKMFSPEEISSMLLSKLKKNAEDYLGSEVKNAVITVPAYFNDAQRTATKDAGTIAGLNVLRIINEPTAAAIAYGLDKNDDKERFCLIFDLGGGTHDCTLLSVDSGVFEVKATSGNCHLGGRDFDQRLVDYCAAEFKRKTNLDITKEKKAMSRLQTACEKAKLILSTSNQTTVEVDTLFDGQDFNCQLSRAKFNEICSDLFRSTLEPVDKVLKDSGISKSQITDVVLVGGSSRIPKVQELLSEYFNGKELCKSINPDEAIAYGAAVQAAILSGVKDEKLDDLVLLDVCPLSLGIAVNGDQMHTLINRNSTIPTKKTDTFTTYQDNQPSVTIRIYEGERKFVKDNNLLGEFNLDGIPPMRAREPKIEISYDLDANGILTVSALEKSTGNSKNLVIKSDKGRLSKEEVERKVKEAEQFKEEDERNAARVEAKNNLEGYCYSVRKTFDEEKLKAEFTEDEKTSVLAKVDESLEWLNSNPSASKEDYSTRLKDLEDLFNPIMQRVYAKTGGTGTGGEGGMPNMNNMGGMPGMNNMAEMFKNMDPSKLQEMAAQAGIDPSKLNEAMNGGNKGEPKVDEVD